MPDIPSLPENAIPTAWLYQPFASGLRLALAVTAGGARSIEIVRGYESVTGPGYHLAVH